MERLTFTKTVLNDDNKLIAFCRDVQEQYEPNRGLATKLPAALVTRAANLLNEKSQDYARHNHVSYEDAFTTVLQRNRPLAYVSRCAVDDVASDVEFDQ